MIQILGLFIGTLLYMELVYHFACFGFVAFNPILALPICFLFAGLSVLLTGFMRKKVNRIIFWCFLVIDYLLFASQLVYIKIFKQPLLLAAITNTGKAAVTNYWREALYAILQASGYLILLALPLIAAGFLLKFKKINLKSHSYKQRMISVSVLGAGLVGFLVILATGYFAKADYYEEYSGFYDPEGIISEYGVESSIVRDIFRGVFPQETLQNTWQDFEDTLDDESLITDVPGNDKIPEEVIEPELDTSPQVLPIDFMTLMNADDEEIVKLAEYMQSIPPTNKNEYTGIFEGYNLIYLTAEGFAPYAVDEELTPTLYKLIHSGFVFEDYYVPLWQTSTSDGEYVNCTGLIPDQQFSFRRSSGISMPFGLPSYFSQEGVNSYAYHNNTLSYYERNLTHPNLGYNFKASKLGDLDEAVWGGQIFDMENANYWPASDLDMMVGSIPEYINEDRFHVYYMTVSGHMNYNFSGNRMSSIHKDEVEGLPYSEEGRAYIACNIELDLALEYLIEQLDAAGKLDNTVICLSADHYPYAMDINNMEELAGKPLEGKLDIFGNNLILWNSKMDTVTVDKTASALDILPTLLNLFGFDYDSRLYVGRDILSDSAPLVIFSDRSFISDRVSYNKKSKEIIWKDGFEEDEEYYEAVKKQVKGLYGYAAGILNNDFYRYVEEALPEEYRSKIDEDWIAPKPPKAPSDSQISPTQSDTPPQTDKPLQTDKQTPLETKDEIEVGLP